MKTLFLLAGLPLLLSTLHAVAADSPLPAPAQVDAFIDDFQVLRQCAVALADLAQKML